MRSWATALLSLALASPVPAADFGADPEALALIREQSRRLRAPAAPQGLACDGPFRVDSRARGAYFRKVASRPASDWTGLRARVVLPQVYLDAERSYTPAPGQPPYWEGPLDRPSVYLGAGAEAAEVDAGLSWDRVFDAQGRPEAGPLKPSFAFRPFWRTAGTAGNRWRNPPAGDQNYFQPGEAVVMTLRLRQDGTVRLDIRSEDGAGRNFAAVFPAPGFSGRRARSFKRVVSIDQFRVMDGARRGNEGSAVLPTRSSLRGARWSQVALSAPGRAAPLSGSLCQEVAGSDTAADYAGIFSITKQPGGGETVDILPHVR
ncbi:MAG: hypothetical protein HY926_06480 [Elusimicrobia bacterium]|nr:hypothetical protein [Elusimicrobiota bacterium]